MAKSTDAGRTWEYSQALGGEGRSAASFPAAGVDSQGNLYLAYSEIGPSRLSLKDVGEGTSPQQVDPEEAGVSRDMAEERQTADARPIRQTHIWFKTSKDHGKTWSSSREIDRIPELNSNVFASLSVGEPGHVAVAFYSSGAFDFEDDDAPWFVSLTESRDADSSDPHFEQSIVSNKIVHFGAICHEGTACALSGHDRSLLDFLGVAIGPDGIANVTWADTTSTNVHDWVGRLSLSSAGIHPAGVAGAGQRRLASTGHPNHQILARLMLFGGAMVLVLLRKRSVLTS